MNTLISVRGNIVYNKIPKKHKEDPDEYKKFIEVVLLCDKPNYSVTNDSDIIRTREIEQLRFVVAADSVKTLAAQLLSFTELADEELAKMEKE